jgi:hypothetical protein
VCRAELVDYTVAPLSASFSTTGGVWVYFNITGQQPVVRSSVSPIQPCVIVGVSIGECGETKALGECQLTIWLTCGAL